jgi:hypothetical protein
MMWSVRTGAGDCGFLQGSPSDADIRVSSHAYRKRLNGDERAAMGRSASTGLSDQNGGILIAACFRDSRCLAANEGSSHAPHLAGRRPLVVAGDDVVNHGIAIRRSFRKETPAPGCSDEALIGVSGQRA